MILLDPGKCYSVRYSLNKVLWLNMLLPWHCPIYTSNALTFNQVGKDRMPWMCIVETPFCVEYLWSTSLGYTTVWPISEITEICHLYFFLSGTRCVRLIIYRVDWNIFLVFVKHWKHDRKMMFTNTTDWRLTCVHNVNTHLTTTELRLLNYIVWSLMYFTLVYRIVTLKALSITQC